uniref:Metaxin-1 n=1 Tax=Cacopsylla melanoneura TaxID=428564 RepID=A0A8D8SFK6_9HEMI
MGSFYKPMELEVWSPDWSLPSVDIDCLYILAYAQFSNVKLEVKSTNNPFRSSSLPVFHHYKHHITDLRKIVDYFKSKLGGRHESYGGSPALVLEAYSVPFSFLLRGSISKQSSGPDICYSSRC